MTELGGNNLPSAADRLSKRGVNINARLAGNTKDFVSHPGGRLKEPNNPELQAYLKSIGMDGLADPISHVAKVALGHESSNGPFLPDVFINAMDHTASDLSGLHSGEYTL